MEKDTHTTDMVFRVDTTKDFKGTVFALFPHEVSTLRGSVTFYQHVGQHGSADYNHCIKTSRPATEDEATANARLILACPELLEACKGAIAALSQNKTFPADIDAAKQMLSYAIAKAENR
jgi:hypothetical protein